MPAMARATKDQCTSYTVKELPWVTVIQDTSADQAKALGWCDAPRPNLDALPRGGVLIWYEYDEDGKCHPKAYVGK